MLSANEKLGLATQLADIERIRRIQGEEKLLLIGHSFGGFLATLYAAEFPEQVKGLVLVAPADLLVMPIKGGGLFEDMRALLSEDAKKEYADYLQRYLDFSNIFSRNEAELAALNRDFAKYYGIAAAARGFKLPSDTDPDWSGGWMVQAMYLSMGMSHDYRQALAKIQAPALVLHGSKDIQSEEAGRRYAELLPRASFKVVPDAGHFIFCDQPQEFASVVGSFLAALK
jgi:proline iminopeptidase